MASQLDLEIVIAHYNEDLSWLGQDAKSCTIYSKGGEGAAPPYPHNAIRNIGREGHTFLYHIIERYDSLADVTLFLQGRVDDHFSITLDEVKERARQTQPGQVTTFPYRDLETFDHWDGIPWDEYPSWRKWSSMSSSVKAARTPAEYWKLFFPGKAVPASVGFQPGALFAVRKEDVRQHPRSFYQLVMQEFFLGDMAHVNPETGHLMERFWQAIFSPEYICWNKATDTSKSERNQWGQKAIGRWNVTPRGLEVDEATIHPKDRVFQFTWGIEMTYFTPYLLQLGLEKSQTSLVWIAPPLSGLIVQPIVGIVSDSSTLRWGRRRPYMLVCALLVASFLLILGWASEIVGIFFSNEALLKKMTVALAIFCIYAVDFAINAVQATCRSLIVDTLPAHEQQLGSAWAGRMLGLGHVLGYFAGTLDLMGIFGTTLGSTQFKQVCVIASGTLVICIGVTCFCVEERVLVSNARFSYDRDHIENNSPSSQEDQGCVLDYLLVLDWSVVLEQLPFRITWLNHLLRTGWSPFFVYGTTWVGETYYRQDASTAAELRDATDSVGALARKGGAAFFLFSLISLAGSIFLPWVVESPNDDPFASVKDAPNGLTHTLRRYRPDITTAWGFSQLAFGISMLMAPFTHSFSSATTLVALCGLPWAMYGWAPLAIMGEEINKLAAAANPHATYARLSQDGSSSVQLGRASSDSEPPSTANDAATRGTEGMAGIYLGIWNIFATIPQFLATFIAMITFSVLEPGRSRELGDGPGAEGPDEGARRGLSGTAVCLAVGALCSFVAATQSFRMRRY
ncbi:hypothetical protein MMC11_003464 [Xylographa trunciseda]|nr:hypothetical protein [Xylographa trunciseda]